LIWRQFVVSSSITLKVLHDIIQAVMGWLDDHLWEFTIGGQYALGRIAKRRNTAKARISNKSTS
jgi:hypothetical protein